MVWLVARPGGGWLNTIRLARMLSFPCPIWQILVTSTFREKSWCNDCFREDPPLTAWQVEFKVNDTKQNYAMKLGEGGEAFFVFETSDEIPASLQTSPFVSPATSPPGLAIQDLSSTTTLQEPEFLDLASDTQTPRKTNASTLGRPILSSERRAKSEYGMLLGSIARYSRC